MVRFRSERGLTLIELSIVLVVVAILASIVTITVTGSSTTARGTTKATDMSEVQKAVNVYRGMHPQEQWPTTGKVVGTQTIQSGSVPAIPFDPANAASFAAIDWSATFTTTLEGTKSLVPSFLSRAPKHSLEVTIDADGDGVPEQSAPTPVWVLDRAGVVYVLLSDGSY